MCRKPNRILIDLRRQVSIGGASATQRGCARVGRGPIRLLFRRLNARIFPQLVQVIGPGLHHPAAFGEVLSVVVGGAYLVARRVSELSFYGIGMPLTAVRSVAWTPCFEIHARS